MSDVRSWSDYIAGLELKKGKQKNLKDILKNSGNALRVGQTVNIKTRAQAYKSTGVTIRGKRSGRRYNIKFVGTMHYAKARCMTKTEQDLLNTKKTPFNVELKSKDSKAKKSDGFVYVICGVATYFLIRETLTIKAGCPGGISATDDVEIIEEEIEIEDYPNDQIEENA